MHYSAFSRLCFSSILALVFSLTASAGEVEERSQIINAGTQLFNSENFDELERLAAEYKAGKSRTSSGLWKIGLLHAGISAGVSAGKSVPKSGETADAFWLNVEKKLERWNNKFPDSSLLAITHGQLYRNRAWYIRGTGYANTVAPADFELYRHYIELARQQLEKNKKTAKEDPQWFDLMLNVARDQSWPLDKTMAVLDEAIVQEPYYYPNYFVVIEYLLPKWSGHFSEMESFVSKSVAATKDREGSSMYARSYWYLSQLQYQDRLFQETAVSWEKMKVGFEDVMKRYPDAWNLNSFARFACMAGDKEKVRDLMPKLAGHFVQQAWPDASSYWRCQSLVAGNAVALKDSTDEEANATIASSAKPVLVFVWAPWAGPSVKMIPFVDHLAARYQGKIDFVRLNFDKYKELSTRFSSGAIPTIMLLRGGKEVGKYQGYPDNGDTDKIFAWLDGYLRENP